MSLTSLYVYDKETKRIHRIGDEQHDALYVLNGEIRYHNLQNGDGGGVKDEDGCGYVILESEDGFLENEFGIIDKRCEKEISEYLAQSSPALAANDLDDAENTLEQIQTIFGRELDPLEKEKIVLSLRENKGSHPIMIHAAEISKANDITANVLYLLAVFRKFVAMDAQLRDLNPSLFDESERDPQKLKGSHVNDTLSPSENEEPRPEEPLTEEEQFVEAVNDAIYPHSLNEAGELGAKKIAKRFGLAVAKEALDIGVKQYLRYDYAFGADASTESVEKLLSKLGGIATNLRKSPEDAAMSHIVALARSSFFYWNNKRGWAILKSCIDKTNNVGLRRQALDDLLQITRTSENWSQWRSRVEEYAEMLEEKDKG